MNRSVATALLMGCVGLAACADGPSTYSWSDYKNKIDAFYSNGVGGRDLLLIVDGDPFSVPDDAFAHKVEASLANAPISREPTRPLLSPNDTANTRYWVVYVFNPPTDLFGNDICQRGTSGARSKGFGPSRAGVVEAVAAFCVEGRALTETAGHTSADGPDDPRFTKLTRLMVADLFRTDLNWETGAQKSTRSP